MSFRDEHPTSLVKIDNINRIPLKKSAAAVAKKPPDPGLKPTLDITNSTMTPSLPKKQIATENRGSNFCNNLTNNI